MTEDSKMDHNGRGPSQEGGERPGLTVDFGSPEREAEPPSETPELEKSLEEPLREGGFL